jgi:hypothetical protein
MNLLGAVSAVLLGVSAPFVIFYLSTAWVRDPRARRLLAAPKEELTPAELSAIRRSPVDLTARWAHRGIRFAAPAFVVGLTLTVTLFFTNR